jgi:hypothetical protein
MATKRQTSNAEDLRAGLGSLTNERDELRGKLASLERQSTDVNLAGGAAGAVATLAPVVAQRDATRAVLFALDRQIAEFNGRIKQAEAAEAEAVRAAARAEAEAALADVVKAASALQPIIDRLADASQRGGLAYHRAGLLALGLERQRAEWEADDVGRRLLGLPPLPTDRDRELVNAEVSVKRWEARLAQLRNTPGNEAERMEADVQAALGTARERLLLAKGERKPRPRVVEPFAEYGGRADKDMGPLTFRPGS